MHLQQKNTKGVKTLGIIEMRPRGLEPPRVIHPLADTWLLEVFFKWLKPTNFLPSSSHRRNFNDLKLVASVMVGTFCNGSGIWMFYIQHTFEDSYFEEDEHWEYVKAAVEGSSFYKLPKVMQWLTGNIGFHHVHHLSPRVPNYKLEIVHNNTEPKRASFNGCFYIFPMLIFFEI